MQNTSTNRQADYRTCYPNGIMHSNLAQANHDAYTPHVGLNAQLLSGTAGYRSAGIHEYIVELLRRLPSADVGLRYTAFANRAAAALIGALPVRSTRWPTARPWARIVWEQFVQPLAARQAQLDLLHGLAFVSPLRSHARPSSRFTT